MKLKKILENMKKMPSTLGGFNETPKLSAEQKAKLMDMVKGYNNLGQKLKMENSLVETAKALSEIAELAETYACNESPDWFATEVIKTDFKRARGVSETFQKIAKECHGKVQQLNALYEDMGHILARYYEISDPMSEVFPNPVDIKSQRSLPNTQPQSVMQEVKPNDKNIKSQRELPHVNGPATPQLKEVNYNESNLQSQRDLPQGGPTSYSPPKLENPEVPVKVAGSGEMNLQGQREEPQNGPAPTQVKEVAPNTSNLQSQRTLPKLGDILKSIS